jgi:hypothetical protein
MAKKQSRPTSTARQERPRATDADIRAKGFTPFLRAEHVEDGEWLKLIGFNTLRDRDTDGEQVVCEVENEHGETFSLRIRMGSPDHRIVHRALGADWKRWSGGVRVKVVPGRERDRYFVNVSEADKAGPIWDGPPVSDREPGED